MRSRESQSPEKETVIDIGGGGGEYFLELARENPDKSFLILEPEKISSPEKPQNLHIVQWRSDIDSKIPLREDSIDEAYITFLLGEIKYREEDSENVKQSMQKYRKIISELKETLKRGGR